MFLERRENQVVQGAVVGARTENSASIITDRRLCIRHAADGKQNLVGLGAPFRRVTKIVQFCCQCGEFLRRHVVTLLVKTAGQIEKQEQHIHLGEVDSIVKLHLGRLRYARLHTSHPVIPHRTQMRQAFEQHGHDEYRIVIPLLRNASYFAQVLQGMVVRGRPALEIKGGFQKAEGVDPVYVFISGLMSAWQYSGAGVDDVRCTVGNMGIN